MSRVILVTCHTWHTWVSEVQLTMAGPAQRRRYQLRSACTGEGDQAQQPPSHPPPSHHHHPTHHRPTHLLCLWLSVVLLAVSDSVVWDRLLQIQGRQVQSPLRNALPPPPNAEHNPIADAVASRGSDTVERLRNLMNPGVSTGARLTSESWEHRPAGGLLSRHAPATVRNLPQPLPDSPFSRVEERLQQLHAKFPSSIASPQRQR